MTIVVLMLAWLIVLLAFFVLAVQLFVTIIEFKLTTLAGFVLVPFALFGARPRSWPSACSATSSPSGIKLMVLAIIVGIGSTLFGATLTPPGSEITLAQAASTILAAIAVFGLAIFVPGIAAGLVSGAPQLGAGAAVATTAGARRHCCRRRHARRRAARALAGRIGGGAVKAGASLDRHACRRRLRGGRHARRCARDDHGDRASQRGRRHDGAGARCLPRRRSRRLSRQRTGGRRELGGDAVATFAIRLSAAAAGRSASRAASASTQAGLVAGTAMREGDRPAAASGPDLKDKASKLMAFKRPGLTLRQTPQPVTPYQKAAQVWDERIGSARVQARNWRLMALGGLALSRSCSQRDPAVARPLRNDRALHRRGRRAQGARARRRPGGRDLRADRRADRAITSPRFVEQRARAVDRSRRRAPELAQGLRLRHRPRPR